MTGHTTGACAAAAAKAAAEMLFTGKEVISSVLILPGGESFPYEVLETKRSLRSVRCAVKKDAGDDPDVTDGMLIFAEVSWLGEPTGGWNAGSAMEKPADFMAEASGGWNVRSSKVEIEIIGGEGIGRVTRPGLDQPVGSAAINSVPRRMIREAVLAALAETDTGSGKEPCRTDTETEGDTSKAACGIRVEISIPGGREMAARTFNPKLGIEGGLSILGTTGIVEPMSSRALLSAIKAEISMHRAEGDEVLLMVPGNYGREYIQKAYGFDPEDAVACSNFVEDAMKLVADAGFRKVFFIGHAGKLIKAAGGVGNTHSGYGDGRMEYTLDFIREAYGQERADEAREEILSCVSMDGAVEILKEKGMAEAVFERAAHSLKEHIAEWTGGRLTARVVIFTKIHGRLADTGMNEGPAVTGDPA